MNTRWTVGLIVAAWIVADALILRWWDRMKAPERAFDAAQLPTLAELKARAFPPTVEDAEDEACSDVEPDFLRRVA